MINNSTSRLSSTTKSNPGKIDDLLPKSAGSIHQTFLSHWLSESLQYIRMTILLSIFLVLFFYPIDSMVLIPNAADFLENARAFYMGPILAVFYLISYLQINPVLFFAGLSLVYFSGGLLFLFAMHLGGAPSLHYGLVAMVQLQLFLFIPSRIPSVFCIPPGIALSLASWYVAASFPGADDRESLMYISGLQTLTLLLSASVILRDNAAHDYYRSLKRKTFQSLDQDLWSSMISKVLKHELGNHITGISSSLEMIKFSWQNNPQPLPGLSGTNTNQCTHIEVNTFGHNPALTREFENSHESIDNNLVIVSELRYLLQRISDYLSIDLHDIQRSFSELVLDDEINKACRNIETRNPNIVLNRQFDATRQCIEGDSRLVAIAFESLLSFFISTSTNTKQTIDIEGVSGAFRFTLASMPTMTWEELEKTINPIVSEDSDHHGFSYQIASFVIELHGGTVALKLNELLQRPMIDIVFKPA